MALQQVLPVIEIIQSFSVYRTLSPPSLLLPLLHTQKRAKPANGKGKRNLNYARHHLASLDFLVLFSGPLIISSSS